MKTSLRLVYALLLGSLAAIGSCRDGAESTAAPIGISLEAPPRLAAISGMTAKVEISEVGVFDLKVATDGSVSGEIHDVPVGKRTIAIRWYKSETVLAEVNRSLDLAVGLRVEVKVTPADFVYPDADGNGVSNIDEILGTKTPTSTTTGTSAGSTTGTGTAGTATGSTPGGTPTPTTTGGDSGQSSASTAGPKLVPIEVKILVVNGATPKSTTFFPEGLFTVEVIIRNDGSATATGVQGILSTKAVDPNFLAGDTDSCLRKGDFMSWDFLSYPDILPGQATGGSLSKSQAGGFQFYLSASCPVGPKTLHVLLKSKEGNWPGTVTIEIQAK